MLVRVWPSKPDESCAQWLSLANGPSLASRIDVDHLAIAVQDLLQGGFEAGGRQVAPAQLQANCWLLACCR